MRIHTSKERYSVEYKTRKRYRGEPICLDSTVTPRENETAFHFSALDRRLWISSYEPAIVTGLLGLKEFKVDQLIFMRIDGQDCVVGVIGRLPIGALAIGRARTSDGHALIFKGISSLGTAGSRQRKSKKKRAKSARKPYTKRRSRAKRSSSKRRRSRA